MNKNPCGEVTLGGRQITHLNPGFRQEWTRIRFLIERDGLKAALEWCRVTMKIYRTAVLDRGSENRRPHYANTREFKATFIRSYLDFKQFVLEYGDHR